ncbi:hypothetical protein A1O1_08722 [Capronia coronata CBS 617.96]|uniref:Uncharacterized protein n=1 Tax=Capronia coronata CBS 617.96 TaxID=1182541 RepID=W9XU96_9EURO|nr:uncharacterized protein A1O1_08722 [Capronia coronata CBS 617.96]EXJ80576.1 hypothetical protein A1O1_08722 [Capronia coronata CBS 617.96]
MSQDSNSDAGSSDCSIGDLRRRQRDTRPRPWLTNSVLRRRSTATSSSDCVERVDAPAQSTSITVPIVSDLAPSTTVSGEPRQNIKKERALSRLSSTVAKAATSVKALAKAAGSQIPQWAGLKDVMSGKSRSDSSPLDRDGEQGKGKTSAKSLKGTGGKTFASRLLVRLGKAFSGRAATSRDKKVGKRGNGGCSRRLLERAAEAPQSCFRPEPIRSHRVERQLTSILKHRSERSGELKLAAPSPAAPTSPRMGGLPVKMEKEKSAKKVVVLEKPPVVTPARHWPKDLIKTRVCGVCRDREVCRCRKAVEEVWYELSTTTDQWLEAQLQLGHDYLELSGGLLGGVKAGSKTET